MRRSVWTLVMVMSGLLTFIASPALAGNTNFGVESPRTWLGPASAYKPTWGGGQKSIAAKANYVFAAFAKLNAYGDQELVLASSNDNGITLADTRSIAYGNIKLPGVALAAGTNPGSVHVIWGQYDETLGKWVLMYTYSWTNAQGAIGWWDPVNISGSSYDITAHRISIATDDIYGVHVVFNTANGMYYLKSDDNGDSFSAPEYVTTRNSEPSIGVTGTGSNVFIAGTGTGVGTYMSRKTGAGPWTELIIDSTNSYLLPSIAVLDENNIYIAWEASASSIVTSTASGGAAWSNTVVGSVCYDPSLAVSSGGVLSLACDVNSSLDANVYLFRSSDGGSRWTGPTTAMADAIYPDIALDDQGKAHIMATNFKESNVYYTREK